MNINEILSGTAVVTTNEDQKEALEQMKEKKVFDLNDSERGNLINFLCEQTDPELAIDYLFHVLDTEISYPIDDEKVKTLFSDDRMRRMKDLMMEKLQDDEEISEEESEDSESEI